MRDKLKQALKDATQRHEEARLELRRAANVLKMHDVLNSGYHNKIVKTDTYPTGILVTTDMMFHNGGTPYRIAGPIIKKDGTPGLRIGYIYLQRDRAPKMEIEDVPQKIRGTMFVGDTPRFHFEITEYHSDAAFKFRVLEGDWSGSFLNGTITDHRGDIHNVFYRWVRADA